MSPENELKLATRIMALLLIAGSLCYAAFPVKAPDVPLRIAYRSTAGNVLFTHDDHSSEYAGYDQNCESCHHNIEDEEEGEEVYDCRECHGEDREDEDLPGMTDSLHMQCIDCHEEEGAGPVECTGCHRARS